MPDPTLDDYYNYPSPQPKQRYGSFAQGVVGGLVNSIQRRQANERRDEDQARQGALGWLKSLPMNEHNAPIITRMALDVMSAKPGKKHWSDQLFGTGQSSNQFIDDLWGRLRSILPPESNSDSESESMPQDLQNAMELPESNTLPNPNPTGPATRPRTIMGSAPLTGINEPTEMAQQPNDETPFSDERYSSMPSLVPPKPDLTGKLDLTNFNGKWKLYPQLLQNESGQGSLIFYDENKGVTKTMPVGNVTTQQERVAQIQAKAKALAAQEAIDKGSIPLIMNLARTAGVAGTWAEFQQLPPETQQPFYEKAGLMGVQSFLGKMAGVSANTEKNRAIANYMQENGGLMPGQVLTNYQQNLKPARDFKDDVDRLRAKVEGAKQALDLHTNPTTPTGIAIKNATAGIAGSKYQTEFLKLQQEYTQALNELKSKVATAASQFPGILTPGNDGMSVNINAIPPKPGSTKPPEPGVGGGNNIPSVGSGGALQHKGPVSKSTNDNQTAPYGREASTGLPNLSGPVATSAAPVGPVTADKNGAPRAVEPVGGYKGTPPPIVDKRYGNGQQPLPTPNSAVRKGYTGVIPGTATAPANQSMVGKTILSPTKGRVKVMGFSPPSKTAPYGLLIVAPAQ